MAQESNLYREPQLIRRADQEFDWGLPKTGPGTMRAHTNPLEGTSVGMSLKQVPVDQFCPWHSQNVEIFQFGVKGVIEYRIEGVGAFRVEPHDLLFIPAGAVYEYRNVGTEQAEGLAIWSQYKEWPYSATYYYNKYEEWKDEEDFVSHEAVPSKD